MSERPFNEQIFNVFRSYGVRQCTPDQIASTLGIRSDAAERALDELVTVGTLELDTDDEGNLFYYVPSDDPGDIFSAENTSQGDPATPGPYNRPAGSDAPHLGPIHNRPMHDQRSGYPYAGPGQQPPGAHQNRYGQTPHYDGRGPNQPQYRGRHGGQYGGQQAPPRGGYGNNPWQQSPPQQNPYGAPQNPHANAYQGHPSGPHQQPPHPQPTHPSQQYAAQQPHEQPQQQWQQPNQQWGPPGHYAQPHPGANFGEPWNQQQQFHAPVPYGEGGLPADPRMYQSPKSPTTAALLSFFPGAGQLYNGQFGKAFFFFFLTAYFYAMGPFGMVFAMIPHAWSVLDAAASARRSNYGILPP